MEIEMNTTHDERKARANAWRENQKKCPECGELLKNCPCSKDKK